MLKKNLKKVLSCTLAAAMVTGMLVGCGDEKVNNGTQKESESKAQSTVVSSETESTDEVKVSYPIEGGEEVTLKIYSATASSSAITANYADWSETPFWKAWQEQTGVKLELVSASDYALLMAGGELPDIVMVYQDMYPGGAEAAIDEGVYISLNDYVDYMPDYMELYNNYPEIRGVWTSSKGDMVGMPALTFDDEALMSFGLIARADWLEDLNLDAPETPDEFYNMLKLFKEEKGATVPFSLTNGFLKNLVDAGGFTSGFGLPRASFYQIDGKIHYGYAEKEYKAVLEWLHMLYEEGLLDHNFATLDGDTQKANIENGTSGVTASALGSGMGTYVRDMVKEGSDYDLCGLPSLSAAKGERSMGGRWSTSVASSGSFITTQCEHPEIAVQFLNYAYTEAGHMLMNFGIEGESYTMENGEAIYTDFVTDNADGWSMQQALAGYTQSWFLLGNMVQDGGYAKQYFGLPQQQEALKVWMDNDGRDYMVQGVSVPSEYSDEYSMLANEIATYVDEMFVKYINGVASLDDFETEYLATLESLGVDRYIELYQIAYDAFMSK